MLSSMRQMLILGEIDLKLGDLNKKEKPLKVGLFT